MDKIFYNVACIYHTDLKVEDGKFIVQKTNKSLKTEKLMQKGFCEQLGLISNQPKAGYGSANDRNTARHSFDNSAIFSSLASIDNDLIERFHVITSNFLWHKNRAANL